MDLPPPGTDEEQPRPAMAHVLFVDVVGYSKLTMEAQRLTLDRFQKIVARSPAFQRAKSAGQLLLNPTGDGVALVFFGEDFLAAMWCALEVAEALRRDSPFQVRMGLHSGPVFRFLDFNGKENVVGDGINTAQRVMDCGDAGHILLSSVTAQFVGGFGAFQRHLHDLGTVKVKHGVEVHLYSFHDERVGNAALPARLSTAPVKAAVAAPAAAPAATLPRLKVAVIYKRGAQPDEELLSFLEKSLAGAGCDVFIDRHLRIGLDWAREIERIVRSADAVIPLLSPRSVESEMMSAEVQLAHEAAQANGGTPRLLPVRVDWEGPLPKELADTLGRYQYALWRGPEDNERVVGELRAALETKPAVPATAAAALEIPGGAMPLKSRFYVQRPADAAFAEAIARGDSIILLKGARQMGKTSLLARGLQQARAAGARALATDLQKLNTTNLSSIEEFYLALGTGLALQLNLGKLPGELWRPKLSPNDNFENYLRNYVLEEIAGPFVWGLDEVDRLFGYPYASEVFGLLRSWHNARASDPLGPWERFTLAIAYATEAHLFIADLNQSPFNVGTRLELRDFTLAEVSDLNQRHDRPLRSAAELEQFQQLLGGQPYLVRRALHELASKQLSFEEFRATAAANDGPFGDHLRRFLLLLARSSTLQEALRAFLQTGQAPEEHAFYRLRAAGLLKTEAAGAITFRCGIYESYFRRHLS